MLSNVEILDLIVDVYIKDGYFVVNNYTDDVIKTTKDRLISILKQQLTEMPKEVIEFIQCSKNREELPELFNCVEITEFYIIPQDAVMKKPSNFLEG